jgi:hypothetical protein
MRRYCNKAGKNAKGFPDSQVSQTGHTTSCCSCCSRSGDQDGVVDGGKFNAQQDSVQLVALIVRVLLEKVDGSLFDRKLMCCAETGTEDDCITDMVERAGRKRRRPVLGKKEKVKASALWSRMNATSDTGDSNGDDDPHRVARTMPTRDDSTCTCFIQRQLDWECIETWNAANCQDTLSRVKIRGLKKKMSNLRQNSKTRLKASDRRVKKDITRGT